MLADRHALQRLGPGDVHFGEALDAGHGGLDQARVLIGLELDVFADAANEGLSRAAEGPATPVLVMSRFIDVALDFFASLKNPLQIVFGEPPVAGYFGARNCQP